MNAQYTTALVYRRMDENGDIVFGAGDLGFHAGDEAMKQVLKTRLAVVNGEWWEDDPGAIPWFSDVLGQMVEQKKVEEIDLMIIERIMDTVGVNGVAEVESYIEDRVYHFTCKAKTVYGDVDVEVTT